MLDFAQEAVDPLIPAWYDLAFSIVPLALVGVMVAGLVSIVRRYRSMSARESFGWTAFVVFAPVLGTLVWFTIGRRRYSTLSRVE